MASNDTHFGINYSKRVTSPDSGGIVFPIIHRLPYGDQLVGWVVVSLSWRSPTLITPFLADIKDLINYSFDKITIYNQRSISQIVNQIKQRFVDWQIGIAFVLPIKDHGFKIYANRQLKIHVIYNGQPKLIHQPANQEIATLKYIPNNQSQLIITNQQLPPALNIVNMNEFVKTLKRHQQLFFIIRQQTKTRSFNLSDFFSQKQQRLLFVLFLSILIAGGVIYFYPKIINQTPLPSVNTTPNPSIDRITKEINQIELLIKTDPANAARQLERLTASLKPDDINQSLQAKIQQLRQQLDQTDNKIFLIGVDVVNPRLKQIGQDVYLLAKNKVYLLTDLDGGQVGKKKVVDISGERIIDISVVANKIFILTPKSIFLQRQDKLSQILKLPQESQPAKISIYLDNVYLISRDGQVFKYDKGAVSYPVKPRLYFASKQISEPTFFLVDKKIYILTKSGSFHVFYFGKPQKFNFETKLEPIINISYDAATNRFWFVNRSGFGAFDKLGKLRLWHKEDNNYRQIITTTKTILLEKEGYLNSVKLSDL